MFVFWLQRMIGSQEDGETKWREFWTYVHAPPPDATLIPATVTEAEGNDTSGFLAFMGAAQSG